MAANRKSPTKPPVSDRELLHMLQVTKATRGEDKCLRFYENHFWFSEEDVTKFTTEELLMYVTGTCVLSGADLAQWVRGLVLASWRKKALIDRIVKERESAGRSDSTSERTND